MYAASLHRMVRDVCSLLILGGLLALPQPALSQCPNPPTGLNYVVENNCRQIRLNWTANLPVTSYRVYWRPSGATTWTLAGSSTTTNYLFFQGVLPEGQVVSMKVEAVQTNCPTVGSEPLSSVFVPTQPVQPTAVGATALANGQIHVTWDRSPAGNFDALIYVDDHSAPLATVYYSDGAANVAGECGSHRYFVQARTLDRCTSDLVATGFVTPVPQPPALSAPASGSTFTQGTPTLSWQAVCGAAQYRLQIATDPGFTALVFDQSMAATSYTWAAPIPGDLYWRVQACGASSCGPYSPSRVFSVQLTVNHPVGGETWAYGQSATVGWWPLVPVKVELFVDPTVVGGRLTGPSVLLSASAPPAVLSVPVPDVSSTRARVQVTYGTGSSARYSASNSGFTVWHPQANASIYFVDGPGTGFQTSMCAGAALGSMEAVYLDATFKTLKHAYRPAADAPWVVTTLASGTTVYSYPTIAVAPSGQAHVAYFTTDAPLPSKLRYRVRTNGQWSQPEQVQTVEDVTGNCSIALNTNGEPLLAFNTGSITGNLLRVRRRGVNGWTEFGGYASPSSTPTQIELRASCCLSESFWVSFIDLNGTRLNVWVYNGTNWVALPGLDVPGPYTSASLALDSQSVPQLGFTVPGPGGLGQVLRHAKIGGGQILPSVTVDNRIGAISSLRIACIGVDNPRIAYVGNGVVQLAARATNGPWSLSTIEETGNMDGPVAFALSYPDDRWILYRNVTANALQSTGPYVPPGGGECNPCDPCDPCDILRAPSAASPALIHRGDALRLAIDLPRPARVDVIMLDVAGRRVYEHPTEAREAGTQELLMQPGNIPPGVYFIRLRVDGRDVLRSHLVIAS